MAAHRGFIEALRTAMRAAGSPALAPGMQAYMKSSLPFHGLPAPQRRALTAEVLIEHPMQSQRQLHDTAAALWREARHREERYAAAELPRQRAHRDWCGAHWLPLLQEMVSTGAWWDHCDEVAGPVLAAVFARDPAAVKAWVRPWAQADDLWLRRASLVWQRSLKAGFDAELFYAAARANLPPAPFSGEFFICKGLGWALRERAYAAPDEVRAFCREEAGRLSPLTRREALRAIDRPKGA